MSRNLRLRSGEVLPLSIVDYDRSRPAARKRSLRSVCYAPFLSMDFDATGGIRLCNHSHTAVAQMSDDLSVLDVWRGEGYQFLRSEMHAYVLDETNCKHCVRQASTGSGEHVFATEQFDRWANDERNPPYPKKLIFRLKNTCNLACIMCDGQTSSRIRMERDKLPPAPSMYGERFFKDMEEILPHVEHVEFYGGEPFLVKEHIRIFEILERVNTKCTIYVNSNTVSLHPKAKRFLQTLNFKTYAVSMDAVDPELHAEIRVGLRGDLFLRNFDYLMELREKRGLDVLLNVTEHRKNWFELPEVFRFAEEKNVYLHINTCIHPHNVTLYTLPSDQLRYILSFFEAEREILVSEFPRMRNLSSYDFLIAMIRTELESRTPGWKPVITSTNKASDGLLGAPRPGVRPFHSPERVATEGDRIATMLDPETAARMLSDMAARIPTGAAADAWRGAAARVEHLLAGLMAGVPVSR